MLMSQNKSMIFWWEGGETKSSQCHSKDLMVTTKLSSIKINKIALSKNMTPKSRLSIVCKLSEKK